VALEEKCGVLTKAKDALKNEYDNLLKEKMDIATRMESAANEKKALKEEYDKILEEKITLKAAYDKLIAENKVLKDRLTATGIKVE
jgi:predicted nuclease with TOPRIM domain